MHAMTPVNGAIVPATIDNGRFTAKGICLTDRGLPAIWRGSRETPGTSLPSWSLWIVLVLVPSVSGCGGGKVVEPPRLFPVTGQVKYRKLPATGAIVVLHPLDKKGKLLDAKSPISTAVVDEFGRFEVRTFLPGDGAKEGEYALTMYWPTPPPLGGTPDQTGPDRWSGRFGDPNKPVVKFNVGAGGASLEPIEVE
ncbi:MAG: hypothetical protein U1D30_13645 [Planctomycetota bacterium]